MIPDRHMRCSEQPSYGFPLAGGSPCCGKAAVTAPWGSQFSVCYRGTAVTVLAAAAPAKGSSTLQAASSDPAVFSSDLGKRSCKDRLKPTLLSPCPSQTQC